MHDDFDVILKVSRCGRRVRQGDNLSPKLFIMLIQLVIEDVIEHFKKIGISFHRLKKFSVVIIFRLHGKRKVENIKYNEMKTLAHTDNGAFLFGSRHDLVDGSKKSCIIMATWFLTVYIGTTGKISKTEVIFSPLPLP